MPRLVFPSSASLTRTFFEEQRACLQKSHQLRVLGLGFLVDVAFWKRGIKLLIYER
jgi:hypothetical protein